ncbi:TNF receptor-associated factor 1 isoform X4 [Tyto alba]|uniref:TNF receptor-associated factor 1 isoform X4 n=1 Tax=Tyto alba TaxID=56313 RepID=UPI001C67B5BC|nr:TNF receptor-associated factor 1 isoform X4 [Tyto alba]
MCGSRPICSLLQMAEKTTRGPQDVSSSSPDENEFPFGYPTNICEDVPDQKYLCSNCNNILKKALQTLCGHRFCSACLSWLVRNNKNAICQKCKEEDPSTLSEGSLLAEERAFGDAAINKEISELKIHCATLGCSWSGIMKNFEEHQTLCEYALIPCHTGCGHMVMRKKLADHLENGCVNNVTVCQKCKRSLSSSEYQEHSCEANSCKEQKRVQTEAPSKEKNCSTLLINKDGCRFSEVGCSFRIAELHRCLTQKDAGLSSLHKSLLFSEQASYDGVFLWKITDVGRKLQDSVTGRTVSLYSPAFYTAKYGYKVCLRVYLNGDGTGKGTHVSLFFVVMKGDYDALLPWPFRHKVTFMLLDQNNREHVIDAFRPDLTSASFQRPVGDMNVASGCPMFLPLCKLQSPKYAYVKEDTLFLKCIIETNQ